MSDSAFMNFTLDTDARGVVTVSMDVPQRPLNILDAGVLEELEQIVGSLGSAAGQRVIVFRSHKESGFLAGADVRRIAEIESPDEARRLVARGQELFAQIERLPLPTVAVLHGPCLGGGLEWALACDYRLARDNSATQIGLPEIKLGLIPGWGGTQRLPQTVGLSAALELILSGRFLDANQAMRIGLIDRAIPAENWEGGIDAFLDTILQGAGNRRQSPQRRWWQRQLDQTAWGRRLVFAHTRRQTAAQREHYPAIDAALQAVAAGYDRRVDGYEIEREQFLSLVSTPTHRSLLDLFFAREAARNPLAWTGQQEHTIHAAPIRTIGIVGAGVMGAGIGQLAANRGFDVVIREIDVAAAEAGRRRIAELFQRQGERKQWSAERLQAMIAKVPVRHEPDTLDTVDLVIEAAVEQESVKHAIFRTLDRRTSAATILASNTSSLSIASMAEVTQRPGQVAGLHFFNPVHSMELVEIAAAPQTAPETIARLVSLVRVLGKTPIVTQDSPGMVVNRVLFPYLGEAVRMVGEGYETGLIDRELRRFGMPMGPLELLDQVGIDVALHVARSLRDVLADADAVAQPLTAMAAQQHLGKKSGRGFYHYRQGKKRKPAELPPGVQRESGRGRGQDGEADLAFLPDSLTPIQRRLVYPMLIEAARCWELRIVDHGWAVDLAMVLGTGFAPHRGGPLHLIEAMGREVVTTNLTQLAAVHGERFKPPRLIAEGAEWDLRAWQHQEQSHEIRA